MHTTWLSVARLRDWYYDTCVTSTCAQVVQSRDWLVGQVVRIWCVEFSRLVVDVGITSSRILICYLAKGKCACVSRGAQRSACEVFGVWSHYWSWDACRFLRPLSRVVVCGGLININFSPRPRTTSYRSRTISLPCSSCPRYRTPDWLSQGTSHRAAAICRCRWL